MIQIRRGVFETNSSSTHSICVSNESVAVPENACVHFRFGEYGWEFDTVEDTASYLYTGIMDCSDSGKRLVRLMATLDELGVKYDFEPDRDGLWHYVDHAEELVPFLDAVLSDKDLLVRFLFGDSFVLTGNDNDVREVETPKGDYDVWYK